ncbi:hypothetical protein R9C00_19250 [Flammeovirgaceae bacterium SG7u.111]|nr:hypothetical protein [Flammeovirgaceae bacterium SG7u.132]WPO33838.1 hypothetical protein R9C00_19250 [Flammeovirgaceae bacterium SG7u.111]
MELEVVNIEGQTEHCKAISFAQPSLHKNYTFKNHPSVCELWPKRDHFH